MRNKDKLDHIYDMITKGLFPEALKSLKSFEKKNKLNPRDKIRVSNFYEWIGERERALTVLGKTKSATDLELATEDELFVQGQLAFFLETLGAKYVAKRLYKNLDEIFKKKDIPVKVKNLNFYKNFAYHFLRNSFCAEALEKYQQLLPLEQDITQKRIILLYQGSCLDALGRYDEAVGICNQVIEETEDGDVLKAVAYADRGEFLFNSGDFKASRNSFDMSEKLFGDIPENKDIGYMKFWSGVLYFHEKKFDSAKENFLSAVDCFKSGGQTFNLIPVLYFLEQIPDYHAGLEDQLLLRAYWGYCEWSFLAGKKPPAQLLAPLHPWIEERLPVINESNDCWFIENGKVLSGNYESMVKVLEASQRKIKVLDLVSGLYWEQGEKKNLTEIQCLCLDGLFGAGRWGIHQWALCDFIYRQEFFDPTSGLNRLKSLLKELKKIGFDCIREKNRYSLEVPQETLVIMSMNHKYEGAYAFLKAIKQKFLRQDIEELFQVKKSTARSWIQIWIDEGKIVAVGTGKDISYKIVVEEMSEEKLVA